MVAHTAELKPEGLEIFLQGSVFDHYGKWNALVAEDACGRVLGWIPAHDGDFFPESPLDHVESLRSARVQGIKGDELTGVWPVRVDIDITQACNNKCTFCYSRPYFPDDVYREQYIPKKHLRDLLSELAAGGTRCVRFTGGGEPLLHPNIREMLPLAHTHGMRLCVITNGDMLDDSLAGLFYEHVDHIRWSVNAATETTRQVLHRPSKRGNLLAETREIIASIVRRRERDRPGERRPMIWATFLILPENLSEMVLAARQLKDIGVDSVSFRPSYHRLGSECTKEFTSRLEEAYASLREITEPPRFFVFTPKRDMHDASNLRPSEHFHFCLSRRLRTVAEASRKGISLQTCGMWRGSGPHEGFVKFDSERFAAVWEGSRRWAPPALAPRDCEHCIDVSMNVTLGFIWQVFSDVPDARFYRARVSKGVSRPPTSIQTWSALHCSPGAPAPQHAALVDYEV